MYIDVFINTSIMLLLMALFENYRGNAEMLELYLTNN